ncbi:MAG: TIGR02147 family protein [Pseudobdellovibrionaceae bacterium]
MSIFEFTDYRVYLKAYFKSLPGGGRGQMQKFSEVLNVHSTFVSLVFKNKRDFSAEQGMLIANFLAFTEAETEYFLNLIHLARAGNQPLKKFFQNKLTRAQEKAKRLDRRFEHDHKLASEERQIFYSSWHYSAIRIFTSTSDKGRSVEEICERFKISRKIVVEALDFLKSTNLVLEKNGYYLIGPQRTYLEKGHPLLKCHHTNWRQKSLAQFEELTPDEMMFTSTLSLSRQDFHALRELLAEFVKKTSEVMKDTHPEDVACLNIDFFWIK